jgi:hypothetical protein
MRTVYPRHTYWLEPDPRESPALVEQGQTYYEERYKERLLHNLSKRAKEFGFQLTPFEPATVSVS